MRISDWSSDVCSSYLAVELDVVELVPGGLELHRILFILVAHLRHILVAKQRVVVEVHLGVERDDVAGTGHHQRVDLHDRGIERQEGLVHGSNELHRSEERRVGNEWVRTWSTRGV